jgi:hypothetical protein
MRHGVCDGGTLLGLFIYLLLLLLLQAYPGVL